MCYFIFVDVSGCITDKCLYLYASVKDEFLPGVNLNGQ